MTSALEFFDTAIGRCGIAGTAHGVARVQLPQGFPETTRVRLAEARLAEEGPGVVQPAPPSRLADAIGAIRRLLDGQIVDLSFVTLDLRGMTTFDLSVYEIARAIPHGETLTYGDIAVRLGDATLARAVGQALGRNPVPIIVPCHRVLAADGRTGGFSAPGGIATKLRMLSIERARTHSVPMLFDHLPLVARR